jgi:hypothetical protein
MLLISVPRSSPKQLVRGDCEIITAAKIIAYSVLVGLSVAKLRVFAFADQVQDVVGLDSFGLVSLAKAALI